nr:FHA domain-containing protein [Gymnodinialimonas phycosphaerae]
MLGFHAQEPDAGLFDDKKAAHEGPQFPAGFLVVVDGPGRGAFFAVTTRVSSIGRAPDQDVSLDFGDESISREGHASVVYDDEQNRFFLGQGNKANVVRRNDTPVLMTEELTHNDTIRIGKTSLRFHAFCGDDFTWSGATTAPKAGRPDE